MARNDDDDFEDRPRKPKRRDADDEFDDRPRKSRRRDDDDEFDDRPRKKTRSRDEDDDFDAPARRPKKKSNLGLILGIIAGVVLLVCGGGAAGVYFIFKKAKDTVVEATERLQSTNNMKQIGLGMTNYSFAQKGFPTNSYDPAGKPLLSWRVHLLPYVNEPALYKQFKLDEPWDSPNNLPLLSRMPSVYGSPSENAGRAPKGTKNYFRAFSGVGSLMDPKYNKFAPGGIPTGPKVTDITDGLSNTIVCVEAGESVEWTKPDDLNWAPGQPLPLFGGDRKTGDAFMAAFGDGSIRQIKKSITPEELKAAITIAGGEIVNLPEVLTPNPLPKRGR